ncbi:MAG: GntR family transcriptional regulator [Anaerolineales bacterium]
MSNVLSTTIEAIQLLIHQHPESTDRLPSEKELVERLGVSRSTVRTALTRLEVEGIVERRWGVGTFVAKDKPHTGFGILSIRPGIPGLLATTGGTPSVYRFNFTEEPPDPELFPDFPETPTLSLVRVFALDGVPAVAIRDRIVGEFEGGRIDPSALQSVDTLVADVLEEVGVNFRSLEVELWAADLDDEGCSFLDLSRSEPVVETRGRGFDAKGRRILIARGVYRTRVVELSLTVA